jgi:hypothetical protein
VASFSHPSPLVTLVPLEKAGSEPMKPLYSS